MAATTAFSQTTHPCGATPSMFGDNLTSSRNYTAFASRGKICIVNNAQNTVQEGPSQAVITSLKYLELFTNEWVLCIGSTVGTQIYNEDGSFLMHLIPVEEQAQPLTRLQCHRACCSLAPPENPSSPDAKQFLCFGDYQGRVDVVEYRTGGSGFSSVSSITGFGPGITCMNMDSSTGDLICGYDDGSILWWSVKPGPTGEGVVYDQTHSDKFEDCPVAIASTGLSLSIAFGTGRIRVFTGKMRLSEIAAHARWITGMSCNQALQMVATVSEDTVLNVWQMSDDLGVQLVHSSVVTDKQLTGVSFLPGESCELAVVAYDSELLFRLKHLGYS